MYSRPVVSLASRRPDFGRGISVIDELEPEVPAGADELLRLARGGTAELPISATVAADVMRLCQVAELPFDRMAESITRDPTLAARVLQLANSAALGSARPAANLGHALMRVGERGLRSVLLSAAGGRILFVRGHPDLSRRLQVRSFAVAVGTAGILRRTGSDRDDGFAAGLLHDIGWPTGIGLAARHRAKLPSTWTDQPDAVLAAVDHVHADLGALIAEQWHFPESISRAIRDHHHPEASLGGPLPWAVFAANQLVDRLGVAPEASPTPESHEAFVRLRLSGEMQMDTRREMWTELLRLGLVQDRRRRTTAMAFERRGQKEPS